MPAAGKATEETADSALFPFVDATVEQVVAYGRFFLAKRDYRVIVWGLLFLAFCLVPALFIDLARLLARLIDLRSDRAKGRKMRDG